MSWMQKLYETYENCSANIGVKPERNKAPLLPVGHIFQQAQIEVIIDQKGSFKGAVSVPKDDGGTTIPCTEESGSRSGSSPKTHPLCDKLKYVSKDFNQYVAGATDAYVVKQTKLYEEYRGLLTKWCESDCSHIKATAVLTYVVKGTVTKDLIDSGVLSLEKDGKLKMKHENLVVRWRIHIPNDPQTSVWTDKSLFDSWKRFDAKVEKMKGLCYITGEEIRLANNHPKYIRVFGDSAKLISANDSSGFTFRGRFDKVEQACGVGYEVTQKAHNALRWLIGKQGKVFYKGKDKKPGLTIVAWATSGKKIPDPMADPYSLLEYHMIKSDIEIPVSTAQELAIKLNKMILGYHTELGGTADIVVMGLDSATPGRMAISFYRELTGSDFLERIKDWHNSCCWVHNYYSKEVVEETTGKIKKVYIRFVGAPAPSDIAEAAYGKKIDDKLRKATVERILPCIIDGQKIPRDIVESAVRRAANRVGMEQWEWNKTLSIACALYRKYCEKEDFDMALDENRDTRDYLYGRLLALADGLEQWALSKAGENRQTNAARLMQRFSDHPYTTWRNIELSLAPYKARLGGRSLKRQNLISEVTAMFTPEEFLNDKKLSGEFLLGYHCQREALWKKDNEEKTLELTS